MMPQSGLTTSTLKSLLASRQKPQLRTAVATRKTKIGNTLKILPTATIYSVIQMHDSYAALQSKISMPHTPWVTTTAHTCFYSWDCYGQWCSLCGPWYSLLCEPRTEIRGRVKWLLTPFFFFLFFENPMFRKKKKM